MEFDTHFNRKNINCYMMIKNIEDDLTLEMVVAVSTEAILGLLIMQLTFKSRSSSAVFWACCVCAQENQIIFLFNQTIQYANDIDVVPVLTQACSLVGPLN